MYNILKLYLTLFHLHMYEYLYMCSCLFLYLLTILCQCFSNQAYSQQIYCLHDIIQLLSFLHLDKFLEMDIYLVLFYTSATLFPGHWFTFFNYRFMWYERARLRLPSKVTLSAVLTEVLELNFKHFNLSSLSIVISVYQ